MNSAAPARKFLLLLALGTAAFAAWKLGAPGKPSVPEGPPPAAAASTVSASGYTAPKDSKCCDKPPSKSALLQTP